MTRSSNSTSIMTIPRPIINCATWKGLALLVLAMMIWGTTPAAASDGYRHDATAAEDNSNWMAYLPGDLLISELSLPGTHDSGSYNFGGDLVFTQTMHISEQLKAGIRVFDIRLRTNNFNTDAQCAGPDLWTFHSFVCQFERFKTNVLPVMQSFVTANPSEALIMRVRDENDAGTTNFTAEVEAEMDSFPGLFYNGTDSNPILNNLRGKILLLANYNDYTRGVDYFSFANIQDRYSIGSVEGLADKWGYVEGQLVAADNTSASDTVYLNYLNAVSGTGDVDPYFFASGKSSPGTNDPALLTGWTSGVNDTCSLSSQCLDEYPRVSCSMGTCEVAYAGINDLATNFIRNSVSFRAGIVMSDFPGPGLIRAIIDLSLKSPGSAPYSSTYFPTTTTPIAPSVAPVPPTAIPTIAPIVPTSTPIVPTTNAPISVTASNGYRHDATAAEDNSKWMAYLPGDLLISELSLPGTHDSGSYDFGGDLVFTQTMHISEQLKAGIRVFDIRLRTNNLNLPAQCKGPDLWTFHNFVCQFERFKTNVLPVMQSFVSANPSEALIMRVRDENNAGTTNFTAEVEAEMDSFPGLFYNGTDSNPTLDNLRGKILLLANYNDYTRGVDYFSFANIQDEYSISSVEGLAYKWGYVKDQLVAADNTSASDTVYLNSLNAVSKTGGIDPYFFASGKSSPGTNDPALLTGWTSGVNDTCSLSSQCLDEYPLESCSMGTCEVAYAGINDLATNFIRNSVSFRAGIIMSDFPGPGLIRAIIDLSLKSPGSAPYSSTTYTPTTTPNSTTAAHPTIAQIFASPPSTSTSAPLFFKISSYLTFGLIFLTTKYNFQ